MQNTSKQFGKNRIKFIKIIAIPLILFVIYQLLPFEIKRKSDINLGNKIIENILNYEQKNNKLPENDDWEVLKNLGFTIEELGTNPSYVKDSLGNFEILFLEGFDVPFLIWNSI